MPASRLIQEAILALYRIAWRTLGTFGKTLDRLGAVRFYLLRTRTLRRLLIRTSGVLRPRFLTPTWLRFVLCFAVTRRHLDFEFDDLVPLLVGTITLGYRQ